LIPCVAPRFAADPRQSHRKHREPKGLEASWINVFIREWTRINANQRNFVSFASFVVSSVDQPESADVPLSPLSPKFGGIEGG